MKQYYLFVLIVIFSMIVILLCQIKKDLLIS